MQDRRGCWIYPAITVQAYLTPGAAEFLVAGIAYTTDLFEYVNMIGVTTFTEMANYDGSSSFIIVPWDRMIADGVRVKAIEAS